MTIIYNPAGKAGEYSELALNLYKGCSHGCIYCYAPRSTRTSKSLFHQTNYIQARPQIIEQLKKEAPKFANSKIPVLLSFTSDPYQPAEKGLLLTRNALEILVKYNIKFTVLTKGGAWGLQRDMALFQANPENTWAVTLTHDDPGISMQWEPNAAPPNDRIQSLKIAHEAGIKTWVSLEPVFDVQAACRLVDLTHDFVDLYKVGKINYHPIAKTIDWRKFRKTIENQLIGLDKAYYIKKDLKNI